MDIKILVAAHKPYWMPDDDVYLPIQVGAVGKESLGWQRDDEGDNISAKNPNYCELTALYWAWKNLDADYIGLCHYRRYFAFHTLLAQMKEKKCRILKSEDYERILKEYDVILPLKGIITLGATPKTVYQQYEKEHHIQDLDETGKILKQLYPEYESDFFYIMDQNSIYFYNMFVMRQELFQQYCQ